jgi:hypothetical protein
MRLCIRSVGVALMAVVAAVLLALAPTTESAYAYAAATDILPGWFGYPFSDQESTDLATTFITGATGTPPPAPLMVQYLPALPPPNSIESGNVIFGYSQGAFLATTYKQDFNQYWANNAGVPPDVTFVLIGNQDRPNGGAFARQGFFPTPTETAGAQPGQITTYDIVRQYDGAADLPTNPLDLLAVANAAAGFLLAHTNYFTVDMSQAMFQSTYGDTNYYLIPTYPLPLLMPLDLIPVVGPLLADTLDPSLRVLVEAGYDRTINPGVPTPFNYLYSPDPSTLASNFQVAIMTGLDNESEDLGMGRPLGTVRPGPYGVGGPPVLLATTSTQQGGTPTPSLLGTVSGLPSLPSPATLAADLAPLSQPASSPPTSTPSPSSTTMSPLAAATVSGPESASRTSGANENADVTKPSSTTTAAEEPSTPAIQVATKPARPLIGGPIDFVGSEVKHPASSSTDPSLKSLFGGLLAPAGGGAAAQGGGTSQGGPKGGEGGGSSPH